MKRHWSQYLWIASLLYLILGFFSILFSWLGMICFLVPLILSLTGGDKVYCNRYCGRGQLFQLLGGRLKFSRNKPTPRWMRSRAFRYGFLIFFLFMFLNMLFTVWLVFSGGRPLSETVTLLWTIRVPWSFAGVNKTVPLWIQQFAFGFYSIMLTSTLLGLVTMLFYKPRSWCVYCPMGTMTQSICKLKYRKDLQQP